MSGQDLAVDAMAAVGRIGRVASVREVAEVAGWPDVFVAMALEAAASDGLVESGVLVVGSVVEWCFGPADGRPLR